LHSRKPRPDEPYEANACEKRNECAARTAGTKGHLAKVEVLEATWAVKAKDCEAKRHDFVLFPRSKKPSSASTAMLRIVRETTGRDFLRSEKRIKRCKNAKKRLGQQAHASEDAGERL
jgi:hypothetical protein